MEKIRENVELSIVVPVLNEEKNLNNFYKRLSEEMDKIGKYYEVIFVNDGSTDSTWQILAQLCQKDAKIISIRLNRNYGQHIAILAGMSRASGGIVVTIDADLQNPPSEIVKLLAKIEEGYDVVGGWRIKRRDIFLRRFFSSIVNKIVSMSLGVRMHDAGCMLRAYKRNVVEMILSTPERVGFIPAIAALYGSNVTEVPISHEARRACASRYNIFKLVKLNYDLLTGFSMLPIQMLTFLGFAISLIGVLLSVYLLIRSFMIKSGTGLEAIYMMVGVMYFFIGLLVLSIGILGEYVGRIYSEVKDRPRYIIREEIGHRDLKKK